MIEAPSWIPGLIALTLGLAFGTLGAMVFSRRDRDNPDPDTPLLDLEEKVAHIVALLRDLEEQQDKLHPEAYAAEKSSLEQRAAEALRQRDDAEKQAKKSKQKKAPQTPAPKTAAAKTTPKPAQNSQVKGFLWGVGTVAVLCSDVRPAQRCGHPPAGGRQHHRQHGFGRQRNHAAAHGGGWRPRTTRRWTHGRRWRTLGGRRPEPADG